MRREYIDIHKVRTNAGQLQGVPKNPRLISKDRFRKLCKSIRELPEMTEARDLLVFPHDGEYVVIGGNMRLKAYERLKWKEVPCCVLPDDTPVERLRQMVIQDNNPFGDNDWDMLANEWDSGELDDWGFDVWQEGKERNKPVPKQEKKENPDDSAFFGQMLDDYIYDSDNEFDIPNLRIDEQPAPGLLLPFAAWGADSRQKRHIQTYHFYVDDYRFEAIWKDPTTVLNSGCSAVVEPNLSLFDTTPVAYGLQLIYKKRWIARFFQQCGVKVYADLNVAQKFYKYNRMGIPNGYNAFATRGYADRLEYLRMEIQIAREISGQDTPNMIVYGGGEEIKEICRQDNVLYVEQFITNRVRKGGK